MNDLEQMRAHALKQMDRVQRNFKAALFGAVLFEAFFTLGIIYFSDFRNPLHLLIICCTGLIYMPIVLGLVALGAHMSRNTLRVLARMDER